MICVSQHYISLIDRIQKKKEVAGTSKHNTFNKRSSALGEGKQMPSYFFINFAPSLDYASHIKVEY